MTADAGTVLLPVGGLTVEGFEDALLIWDETRKMLHHLDLRAAAVWESLDGRDLGQVAASLARDLGADESLVRGDVITVGNTFLTEGLARAVDRRETHAFGRGSGRDAAN